MKELAKGIVNHVASDALGAAITRIYNTEASSSAVFPYIVFTLINSSTNGTFTEKFEEYLVQFNIYSENKSSMEACNIFNLLIGNEDLGTGFDHAEFDVDDHTMIVCQREPPASLSKWTVDCKRVWDYMVSYRILLQKD